MYEMKNRIDLKQVQKIVADLRTPNQMYYFTDLLITTALGWGAFIYALSSNPITWRLIAFIMAVLLLYRSVAFIHELFHQKSMKKFRHFWHAILGIPLLLPLLLYLPIHKYHHNKHIYGTLNDGEYEHLKGHWGTASFKFFALNILMPFVLLVRFAVLPPLALFFPKIRGKVIPEFVHLTLRVPFRAPSLSESDRIEALVIEWFCCAWAWSLIIICIHFNWTWLIAWSILLSLIATLNIIRALGATHLYVETEGGKEGGRDARDQMLDSINISSNNLAALILCPVGTRFHALHHIAPYLPYHSLPQAHRRLMQQLPKDSEYHQVTVFSIGEGLSRCKKACDETIK